jgi:glycosyltransferase involved in cell wall biosynthesis
MHKPLVSIIIPTYNRNQYLNDCLQSVSTQTYENIEVIVVDDSGNGNAQSVVESFDNIVYKPLNSNQGPTTARNQGIELANGKYIQLLDDDDYLLPNKIKKQIRYLEKNDAGVVYCGYKQEDKIINPPENGKGDVLKIVLEHALPECVTSTMLIDAEFLNAIHPLPETPGSDDTFWKIELAQRTEFDYINEILVRRESPPGQRSTTLGAVKGSYLTLEKYQELYDKYSPEVRRRAKANATRREANYIAKNSFWSPMAVNLAVRAVLIDPNPSPVQYMLPLAYLLGKISLLPSRYLYNKIVD